MTSPHGIARIASAVGRTLRARHAAGPWLALAAAVALALPGAARATVYYPVSSSGTSVGVDGTTNLPAGNTASGTWRTLLSTTAPTGTDTSIAGAPASTTLYTLIGTAYLSANYASATTIAANPTASVWLQSTTTTNERFQLDLVDYDPAGVAGNGTVIATITGVASPGATATLTPVTLTGVSYVVPAGHRLALRVSFKPRTAGDVGQLWCNSSAHASSVTVTETAAPGVPGTPTFTSIADTTLTVNWTAASGATSYKVERAPDVSGSAGTYVEVGTGVSSPWTDPGPLTASTKYWYRVRGTNGAGDGAYSAGASVTTTGAAVPPGAPGALSFSSITQTTLSVSWTAASGATSYKVERAPDVSGSAGTYAQVASGVAATSWADPGPLTAATKYWYRVRGTNTAGDGSYGTAASVTTAGPVGTPGTPTFSSVTTSTLTVGWTAATNAATYKVERAPDVSGSAGTYAQVASGVAATSWADPGPLAPGTTYWYRVRGTDSGGVDGPYSTGASVTTAVAVPGAPGTPTFSSVAQATLTVSWTAATGATSYKVERAPDNAGVAGTYVQIAGAVAGTSYPDSGLTANTKYWYRVRGTNTGGDGAYGAGASVTTLVNVPGAPGTPSFASVTQTSLTVSWTAATGSPTGYKLERAPDSSGSPGAWAQIFAPATTSQADSGLTPGVKYWYRVRAANAGGDGPYGAAASVTTLPATTAVGDGTNPSAASICPGGAATPIDAFTLSSTGAADVITNVTVSLSPAGAFSNLGSLEVTDDAGVSKGTATPLSDTVLVQLATAIASPLGSSTQYKLRITPRSHAAMAPGGVGQSYATTAVVATVTGLNPGPTIADTSSATVTIDNRSPGAATWGAITTVSGSVTLAWTNPTDSDLAQVIVLRKTGGPVTDVPTEGVTTYVNNATIGASTVVYSGTGTTSGALTVTNGTSYYFRIFARDTCGNWSAGTSLGPIVTGTAGVEGDPAKGTQKPTVAIVNPGKNTAASGTFKVQLRVFNPNTAEAISLSGLSLNTDGSATTFPVLPTANVTAFTRNSNYGTATNSGVFEATVSGLVAGSYTLRARATNAAGTTNSGGVAIRVNASKIGDGNILRRDNSSQLCSDCHNLPPHSSETSGSQYGSWATVCGDCHAPHGTTNIYLVDSPITPPAVNGYQAPKPVYFSVSTGYSATGGASNKSTAGFTNGDNTGVCQACHTRTASLTGGARFRNTGAVDGHYTAEPATTSVSMTTAPCSACHQHSTGFAPTGKHCKDCHLSAPAVADVDSWAWGDTLAALVSVDEWTTRGHGSTAAYPSGNVGAGFDVQGNALGDRGCLYCHSSSTSHNDSTNFFRLNPANKGVTSIYVGYAPGDGWNSVCLICHGKTATYTSPGFDPDGAGTDYAAINSSKKLGSDHYAHAAGNPNGGTYCWDCHDPHGDKSASGNDLWFMIQRRPVMATTGTDSGVPLTLAANVEFRGNLGGTTTAIDYPDYVYPPPPGTPVSGICRVCHTTKSGTTGTNHYNQSTTTDSHPDGTTANVLPRVGVGLSPRDRCTDCHQHAKQCNECHAAPQTAGRHPKHDEVAALPTSYTDVSSNATAASYGFRCGKCHQGTHPKDTHAGTLADSFVSDTIFDATANPKNTGASYARGGTVSTVQGVAGGDYSTRYWGYTDGTCSNLYCHSNAAPLGGTNTYVPINWLTGVATTCTSCHDTAGAATTLSPAHRLHTDPAKYNIACERCHTATGTKTALTNKANHVNGVKDVAFDSTGVNNSGGSYTGATAYTCSNTYCHSSGASRTAPYTSGPSTAWNANTTCTSCHPVGSTLLTTVKHPAHINNAAVIGTNFTCTNCHTTVVGAGNPPTAILSTGFAAHVDGIPTLSFSAMGAAPAGGTYSSGTCSSTYCHSSGQAAPTYQSPTWAGAALGCNGCHGVGSTYGEPNYANGGVPPATTSNSHAKHVTAAADCGSCHGATTTNGTAIVLASTTHINGAREVAISPTYGASATYASGTKTCSNVSCHGTGSPVWGATLPCGDCHLGAADVDNWVINDGTLSVIGSTEWTYSGHAKTTAYDVSGNPAAAFAGTNPCVYCHDPSVSHKLATNPFRLANVGGADGMNGNCLICHKTGSPGFTPSGYAAKNRTTSKVIDDTHYGAKHAAGNNGGKLCWDCHDPHGDRSNSTTGNIYMMQAKVAKQTDGTYGLPTTTVATTFTAHATGTDYAQSASPWSGICNVCHTTTTHYTATAGDSHNSTTACLSCHSHTDPTYTVNEGFKPKAGGDCLGCHGTQVQGPRRAVTADFADGATPFRSHHAGSAATNTFKGTLTNFDCVVCHAEGTVSAGQTATTAKHNDGLCANAKNCIDLRNVDTPTTSYPYDKRAVCVAAGGTATQCDTASTAATPTPWAPTLPGNLINWSTSTATWRTQTSTNLDLFCLSCHDSNGASGLSAAGLLQTGATATNPYADTTLTNNYDQAVRSAPVNIKDMVAGTLGTFARHSIRGQSASVYSVYQGITGQTCTTNNKGTVTSVPCKTMYEQGLFQVMAPADAALPAYWNDTSQMSCADCHTSDGSNGVNGNAHGANSEYLLKDSTGGATKGTMGSSTVAGTYVCYKCHFDSPKSGHSGSGSNFIEAVALVGSARTAKSGSVFGMACMGCHGGAPGNGEATQLGFGRIHGTNQVFYIDTPTGPGTRNAYRFTNGGGLRFYDPGSWNDAVAYGAGGKSCYTLGTADTWSGCTQHSSGYSGAEVRGTTSTVARPLSY